MSLSRIQSFLLKPTNNSTLILLRIVFGLIMFIETCRYFPIAAYQYHSGLHFTYRYLDFIGPPSSDPELNATLVEALFVIMMVATAAITVGFLYRISIFLFFVIYTYFFLIDEAFYNNHFYVVSIVSGMMCFMNLSTRFSLDAMWKKESESFAPFWYLAVLRMQWVIIYFFGGLAKIQPDWIRGEPVRGIFLSRNEGIGFVIDILGIDNLTYIVAWGGILFDLFIPFLLLFKVTRKWAIPFFLFFHVSNHFLFDIGIFPWLAIGSVAVFFDPDTPFKVIQYLIPRSVQQEPQDSTSKKFRLYFPVVVFFSVFFALQLTMPLRHYFYTGRSGWTQQGYKFAWRMMLNHWDPWLRIIVVDKKTGKSFEWNRHDDITNVQMKRMLYQPRMLAQYARFIQSKLVDMGIQNAEVQVQSVVSMNGRPFQFLVNPRVDASSLGWDEVESNTWIVPLMKSESLGDYAETMDEKMQKIANVKLPKQSARQTHIE